jgi:hypothetical protein
VRRALGAAAAVALPPAEAIAVAQAMEALAGGGFAAPRFLSPQGAARRRRGLASGAALLGSCLPR